MSGNPIKHRAIDSAYRTLFAITATAFLGVILLGMLLLIYRFLG